MCNRNRCVFKRQILLFVCIGKGITTHGRGAILDNRSTKVGKQWHRPAVVGSLRTSPCKHVFRFIVYHQYTACRLPIVRYCITRTVRSLLMRYCRSPPVWEFFISPAKDVYGLQCINVQNFSFFTLHIKNRRVAFALWFWKGKFDFC